jgi:lipopolysaccharide transport system permease protein
MPSFSIDRMARFSATPREMVASFWRHRALIAILTKREVVGRYRGSMLGLLWSFLLPVFMLGVYTFVFSAVFKARWTTQSASKSEFALVLFAGLMVFNLFAECVNRAPALIKQNQNYVKKVVFPLEILPWISLGAALFHTLVSFAVWQLFFVIFFGAPAVTAPLFILVLLPLVLFTIGVSWLLAALSVYLRDLEPLVGVFTTALMFMSPIFYPMSALPERLRGVFALNPLAAPVEYAREVLFWSRLPDVSGFMLYTVGCGLVAWAGFATFQKLRSGFADVL